MNLLWLSKRHPQQRDLFRSPHGRYYHLPRLLAKQGIRIQMLLLGYQHQPPVERIEANGGLSIRALAVRPDPRDYYRAAVNAIHDQRPDWIIGSSDIWFAVLAVHLGRRFRLPTLIDAYDNFETYHPMIPPLRRIWRQTLRRADRVVAAGPQLAEWMSRTAGQRQVEVVPMAADPEFYPRDRGLCRQHIGLPPTLPLLGYVGSLDAKRGVETLFGVYRQLRAERPELRLVVSGRRGKGIVLPDSALNLGYRPAAEIPLLLNSLNLVLVLNRPTAFGNYSYPAKLYEAMRCQIPVVAADVPGTAWILRDHPNCLAPPDDIPSFLQQARIALSHHCYDYGNDDENQWAVSAQQMAKILT